MKAFAALYRALDETNKTAEKVDALAHYFAAAPAPDAAWAVYFLTGSKLRSIVPSKTLREWAVAAAEIPEWLFQESYDAVGDLAETIAISLPRGLGGGDRALHEMVESLVELRRAPLSEQKETIVDVWMLLDERERLVWNKLLLGNLRVGVSKQLVVRGLAQASGIEPTRIAEALTGSWAPVPESYARLIAPGEHDDRSLSPFPFFLAHSLDEGPEGLGAPEAWRAEWKWDGIRGQLVCRRGEVALWSRGDELVTERFPEIEAAGRALPDGTVIDGEILAWSGDAPLAFGLLQKRITRKSLSVKILREIPIRFQAYDLLERDGMDVRELPLEQRRTWLEEIIDGQELRKGIALSPTIGFSDWSELAAQREQSRARGAEGLMLKRLGSPYRVGRVRGDWWKWKIAPFTVDAVLTAARRGSGKRASLYTDYTFSVWDDGKLVPFAQAYSGLDDDEIARVDAFVRAHMREKFGPVRSVEPRLVFEIAFEGIQRSTRHKSGVAVRFPRIHRWRHDKTAAEADALDTLRALLGPEHGGSPRRGRGQGKTGRTTEDGLLFDL